MIKNSLYPKRFAINKSASLKPPGSSWYFCLCRMIIYREKSNSNLMYFYEKFQLDFTAQSLRICFIIKHLSLFWGKTATLNIDFNF